MVCSICVSRARFTVESGVCFCCTDITAINKAQMSVVLTVISLGLRVVLAYILSVPLKAPGIWVAIVNHKNLKEI